MVTSFSAARSPRETVESLGSLRAVLAFDVLGDPAEIFANERKKYIYSQKLFSRLMCEWLIQYL